MKANNNMTIIQSNIVKEPTAVFATVARNGHATPDGANISREFYVTGVKMWPGPVDQNWNAENPFVISNESVTDAYQGTCSIQLVDVKSSSFTIDKKRVFFC